VLTGLDTNSPCLLIDNGNGAVTIMDREMFDYLYEESSAPDPAQRDLDIVLPRVTRVRAIASGMFRGRAMGSEVVLETMDAKALTDFRKALRIVEDPATFTHCGCLGGPTLELYADQELVATIGLQHGHSFRWAQWKHDARLRDGQVLTDWLLRYGIDPAFLEVLFHNGYDALGLRPLGFQRSGPAPLTRAEQRVRLAELRRANGDVEGALSDCQKELDADPGLALGYAVRAFIRRQQGNHSDCFADCSEAIRLGLREADVFFTRAVAADYLGRPEEAVADCTAALQIDVGHVNAYKSRGMICGRLGRLDEAAADFSEAIRLAPEWFLPYYHRAEAHHGQGKVDMALTDYDKAIELLEKKPPSEEDVEASRMSALIRCRRGEARYDQFREEESEADFAEARHRDPAEAAGYLGDMWLRRSKFGQALEVFSQLVQFRPADARGYAGRGMAREALGELDEAAADYSEAIRLQPHSGVVYALRARVRQRQDRPDEALADLSEHLRLNPDDAAAYVSRSFLYRQRGAWTEVVADLNAAHHAAPDHPLVCNNLAWFLATCPDDHLRDGPRAVALARQACQATEWKYAFCLGTLGAACAETGAFEEAIRWQSEALELYPEEEKAAGQARLELYRARKPYREGHAADS
jgi:tetratricopeptide (TPR) repeat protein